MVHMMQQPTYHFTSTRNQVGSAVVYLHEVDVKFPVVPVRAAATTDLRPTHPTGVVRETAICQVRIRTIWYPCIVVELNELRALAEEIVKVQENALHLEKRGRNIAMELGLSESSYTKISPLAQASNSLYLSEPRPRETDATLTTSHTITTPASLSPPDLHATSISWDTMNIVNELQMVEAENMENSTKRKLDQSPQEHVRPPSHDEEDDVINKMSRIGFWSSNMNSKVGVPSAPEILASLPEKVWSEYYKRDIRVADLRYGMWQRNTWFDATKEAFHCLFSEDELTTSVMMVTGTEACRQKLLDPKRVDIVLRLATEISEKLQGETLGRKIFGHCCSHIKNRLRARLGLSVRPKKRSYSYKVQCAIDQSVSDHSGSPEIPLPPPVGARPRRPATRPSGSEGSFARHRGSNENRGLAPSCRAFGDSRNAKGETTGVPTVEADNQTGSTKGKA